ncbi:MAG TPA: hypothetical protein VFR67_13210 [Pilimelia sp.]|nr:hypothetical protein [Pilimelia sp.]
MRTRLSRLSVAAAVLIGGCTEASAQPPQRVPAVVAPEPAVASAAGGACELLDFVVIAQTLGARFDVAAATRQDETHTCVVQNSGASRPDLVLTVTPTSADAAVFDDTVTPDGGREVSGLGKAAYRVMIEPGRGHGPGVEIGWLSADNRLITLRYTLPAKAPESRASAATAKLVTLAKRIDVARR